MNSCYRALFPCLLPSALSVASDFCATITANGATATNYPSRATLACGRRPDRYVSACSCGPTCAPTPTGNATASYPTSYPTATAPAAPCSTPTDGLLLNGGFECGLLYWDLEIPAYSYAEAYVSSGPEPGIDFDTGTKALKVIFPSSAVSPEGGVSARITSRSVPVVPGTSYLLKFSTFFDNLDAGFVGVMFNGVPVRTVDARDNGWGIFHANNLTWTPNAGVTTATVRFEFLFNPGVGSVDRLDSVIFGPA